MDLRGWRYHSDRSIQKGRGKGKEGASIDKGNVRGINLMVPIGKDHILLLKSSLVCYLEQNVGDKRRKSNK